MPSLDFMIFGTIVDNLNIEKLAVPFFHSIILGRLGKGYCKKIRALEFLAKIFG